MMMLMTAAALAAGQPAATPAPMPMEMPAGHDMPMTDAQHAAKKDKCCCEHMGDKGHDMDASHHEHGE